jgi:hypothetical protein
MLNLAYPTLCRITLLSCYTNLRNFGALVLSYDFFSQLLECYVNVYVCSFRFLTYDCTLVPMATSFLNHIPFCHGSSLSWCTRTHLVLTSVVMSGWTTLDLRRSMWKHGLS